MNRTAIIIVFSISLALCNLAMAASLLVPLYYPTIQSAIDDADDGDYVIVYPGTYTGPGNNNIDFLGKAITVQSIDPTNPDIVADTIVNCSNIDYPPYDGFVFHNSEDANSVLDGFTITGGGRAIECEYSSPTIKNCVITGNSHNQDGVIYFGHDSGPTITDCTITNNIGSGICCDSDYSYEPPDIGPIIKNCTITGNTGYGRHTSTSSGGGISVMQGLCLVYNSIITDNHVGRDGGGIYCDWGRFEINNCIIASNTAGENGGAIFCPSNYEAIIRNCTIVDNSAGYNGGGICSGVDSITNSIIWGNSDSTGSGLSAQIYNCSPNVWFSCIQDDNSNDEDIPFGNEQWNIDDDPCFADGYYHLLNTSPCIEAGDPVPSYLGETDIDGQPRRMGPRADMGADEFETTAVIVTKPKGGEVWAAGSTHEIKWDSYDITGPVDIYYSDNNGFDWTLLDSVPDTGSYTWHLPYLADSNQCLIAVEPNIIPPNLINIESGLFTINPYWHWPPMPQWQGHQHNKSGPRFGCVKWKFQSDGPITAGLAVGYNRVYVPCEDGKLYALNAAGNLLWTYDTNSPLVGSPAVSRYGTVYIGAENGKLYAIGQWGRLLWTHTTDKPIYSSPTVSADGNIYVSSLDGKLHALAHDGSELWTFETGGISPAARGGIFASPAINPNGTVYIAGVYDPNLYALDANDGSIIWSLGLLDPCAPDYTPRRAWPLASPVIADDGIIYQTLLYDPNLYAIDPNDGSIIWSAHLADPCSGWFDPNYINQHISWNYSQWHPPYPYPDSRYASSWSKPALAPDGTIYVSFDDPYLRAVDPNGDIKWVTRLGMMGGFTLTVGGDGFIYAACDDGQLYVVDPNGQEISRFEGSKGLAFPAITAGHTVIVSGANNTLWAISPYNCWGKPLALHRPEDLNADSNIDFFDFAVLASGWLDSTDSCWPCGFQEVPVYPEGDIDKSLYTEFTDIAQLASQWLE